jgi:hypothetical protein
MSSESGLVENRECGDCTACCTTLRIDEPDLKKHADISCKNLSSAGGCQIYDKRPSVCRNWHCAWRFMENLADEWRPDKSGVMLRLHEGGLILQPIKDVAEVLTTELALGLIGSGVENDVPMFISVPTKKGYCYSLVKINEKFKPAVATRNFLAVKKAMLEMIIFAMSQPTDEITPFN